MATATRVAVPANFIEQQDEEPVLELARFMHTSSQSASSTAAADLSGGAIYEECEKMLAADPAALLEKFLVFVGENFAAMNAKDMEGAMQCLFLLLRRLEKKAVGKAVNTMCDLLTSSKKEALVRVQILATLYNQLDFAPPCRFAVFSKMLAFCSESAVLTQAVSSHFENLEAMVAEWRCPAENMRTLYWQAVQLMEKAGNHAQAFKILLKLLKSADGGDAAVVASVEAQAVHACVTAIGSKEMFTFDELLDLDAVAALQGSKEFGKLHELLRIFVCEKLEAYVSFTKKAKKIVGKLGLDDAACTDKMRLLTLTTLANDNTEVSYSTVAANLLIGEDEVEEWVIRAISEELIEARMHQLRSVVMIIRSTQRQFDEERDWAAIAGKLDEWQQNVQRMAMTVESATPRGR